MKLHFSSILEVLIEAAVRQLDTTPDVDVARMLVQSFHKLLAKTKLPKHRCERILDLLMKAAQHVKAEMQQDTAPKE
jgi:hypothetical protein